MPSPEQALQLPGSFGRRVEPEGFLQLRARVGRSAEGRVRSRQAEMRRCELGTDGNVSAEAATFTKGQPVYLTMFLRESPVGLKTQALWTDSKKKEVKREERDMKGAKIVATNNQTGAWVVGNAAGTSGATLSLGSPANTANAMTTGNITINPFSSLLFFLGASYGIATQGLTLNGIGAQLADGSAGSPGALRTNTNVVASFNGFVTLASNSVTASPGASAI